MWITGSQKLLLPFPPRYRHQQCKHLLENHYGCHARWDHSLTVKITTHFWFMEVLVYIELMKLRMNSNFCSNSK